MKAREWAVLVTVGLLATAGWAQGSRGAGSVPPGPRPEGMNQPAMGSRDGDPFAEQFFPPELVMVQAKKIALTEEQQKTIKEEMQKAQVQFVDLQWQISAETETLTELIKETKPDEAKVLAQLDKVMGIENAIKKMHLTLVLRIRNALTASQQEQLRDLMKPPRPMAQMGMSPPARERESQAVESRSPAGENPTGR